MFRLIRYLLITVCSLILLQNFAYAGVCLSSTGLYTYNYSNITYNSTNNTVGTTTGWLAETATGNYKMAGACHPGQTVYYSALAAQGMTRAGSSSTSPQWFNLPDNDYLQVASQIYLYSLTGSSAFHDVPFTGISNNCNDLCGASNAASGSKVNIKLKIKKKFVGGSFIVNEPIAYLYGNSVAGEFTGSSDGTGTSANAIVAINLSATMTVPQSCTINAGTTVSFDFGNLSAQSFLRAGAGQKPSSASTITKNVGITCNNIAAQSTMTLRIEANNISGNAIVSDNADVGFILANGSGQELTPNNLSSVIPFVLGSNDSADVTLQSWPVSITGKQPAAGPATATGYLRVDFQ